MEWIEVVADSVDAATERAVDLLGVAVEDVEIEVIDEPVARRLGRSRPARVRARLRPVTPAPKIDRRDRRRGASKSAAKGGRGRQRGRGQKGPKSSGSAAGSGGSGRRKQRSSGGRAKTDKPAASTSKDAGKKNSSESAAPARKRVRKL